MYLQIMNALDLFTKTYGKLQNYGMPFWVMTPFRRTVRGLSNFVLPKYLSRPYKQKARVENGLIVSFTSFPSRIDNVWQVVECMKRQSLQPDKILLWLSKDQFPTEDTIPDSLISRRDSQFEIRMVDGDIRSHKKYYYVSKEYPKSKIVLIDDDIYYPTYMLEELYLEHLKHPNDLISRYAFFIHHDDKGYVLPYRRWHEVYKACEGDDVFFGSGGGTLFTPDMMYEDLLNEQLFLNLTPIADDIWLNAMIRLRGTNIRKIPSTMILPIIGGGSKIKLSAQNVGQNKNDEQIKNVVEHYKKELSIILFQTATNVSL